MMNIKNIALILLFALSSATTCYAQTFLKYFAIDSVSTIAYSMVEKDSFLYVCGVVVDTANAAAIKSFMAKFDNSGNMISNATYRPPQYSDFYIVDQNGLINTSDNGFAATGFVIDTNGIDSVCFTKFDSVGNLLYYKTYAPNIPNYMHTFGFRLVEYDSAYFILGDIQLANYYVALMLIKLDLSGNLQFIKTYQNLPFLYGSGLASLCTLPDNKLLLTASRSDENFNYWQINYSTCFIEVDTAGNLIHQYCTTDSNTQTYYNLATTYDGNYLSCGSYYELRSIDQPGEMDVKYLVKRDSSFNKIWSLKTGGIETENAFTDFEQTLDNSIILCGQNVADTGIDAGYHGVLSKVSKDGDIIWFHEYAVPIPPGSNPNGLQNYLYDVDLLSNGDIVAAGSWYTSSINSPLYFQQVGWILRVDSNGCMEDGNCGLPTEIEGPPQNNFTKAEPIRIFPNPGNGIFTVNSAVDLPGATTIEVYDALGRKLLTQLLIAHNSLINLYHLPSGIYFYRIGNGLVNVAEGKFVIQK